MLIYSSIRSVWGLLNCMIEFWCYRCMNISLRSILISEIFWTSHESYPQKGLRQQTHRYHWRLSNIFLIQDTVTGFLLTGIGERNVKGENNYLIVDESNYLAIQKWTKLLYKITSIVSSEIAAYLLFWSLRKSAKNSWRKRSPRGKKFTQLFSRFLRKKNPTILLRTWSCRELIVCSMVQTYLLTALFDEIN